MIAYTLPTRFLPFVTSD